MTRQKLIVSGSRTITDTGAVAEAVDNAILALRLAPVEIVHGGARGVDTVAARLARDRDYPVVVFDPDNPDETETEYSTDELGDAAYPMRNQEMAQYGDGLVAVWDGESPGTRNMIEAALDEGLPVLVDTYDANDSGAAGR